MFCPLLIWPRPATILSGCGDETDYNGTGLAECFRFLHAAGDLQVAARRGHAHFG